MNQKKSQRLPRRSAPRNDKIK